MKIHRSAKINVYQRRLLITRVRRRGWTQRRAAEAAGVSVRTVAKWLARPRRELADRSSRPHHQPRRTPARREAAVIGLRQTRATGWQISKALKMPRSTVTRILARAGLNRVACLEPPPLVRRYEYPNAGDLLHVDLTRLGRIAGSGAPDSNPPPGMGVPKPVSHLCPAYRGPRILSPVLQLSPAPH